VQPRVADVRLLLDTYGVTDEATREALFTLTREARQRGWWRAYGALTDNYVEFEAAAKKISTYEPAAFSGLLQTPAYATAVRRGWSSYMKGAAEVEERRTVFQHLSATALGPDDSIAHLGRPADHP
jgi:hypothetical protein